MAACVKSDEIVLYKGRSYRLLWKGETKYGKKAKLCFLNDSGKVFWVPLSMVFQHPEPEKYAAPKVDRCPVCGDFGGGTEEFGYNECYGCGR